jgi:hypothetical protein
MSGYNETTGVYELTVTKAQYWSKRDKPIAYFAGWLKNKGVEVVAYRRYYIEVRATETQIYNILSCSAKLRQDEAMPDR